MERLPARRDFLRISAAGALGALFPALAPAASAPAAAALHLVQPNFFSLHMVWPTRRPYAENFPTVPVGAWRAILPELHWFSLEPRKGEWKFDKLDIAMRLMESRGVDVLLTLGQTPAWASSNPTKKGAYVFGQDAPPRSLADWENYVRTVAQRYRGRIRNYELWNEPTVREVDGDRADFSAGQLVELGQAAHRILREIDPQARLTTPSMVGGEKGAERMEAYLAAGGNRCADIVSFHYYGLPEQIPQYHAALLKVMARHGLAHLPMWNTEFGFLIADPTSPNTFPLGGGSFSRVLPEQEAAAWLARSLIIAASLGIERFYWFMWDGKNVGLTTYVGHRINAAGVAYGTVARWLTGRQIGQVQRAGNVASCTLAEHGTSIGQLAWTHDYKTVRWPVPKSWNAVTIETLDGQRQKTPSTGEIELSASPVLIRSSS
ncbi:MAG: endo-1,4-beta-xylanase [Sulfuricella sp.]